MILFAAMGVFPGAQEQVRNSRGKRVIGVEPLKFYCNWNIKQDSDVIFVSVIRSELQYTLICFIIMPRRINAQ